MPYSLSFVEQANYLQVNFSGDFGAGDVKALWHEMKEYLTTHPHQRVLVKEHPHATGRILPLEVFEAAASFAQSMLKHRTKIAVLYRADVSATTLQEARFGETVALNRGLRLRVFLDRAAAEQWLCHETQTT